MITRRTTEMLSVAGGKIGLSLESGGDGNIDYAAIGIEQKLLGMGKA